MDYEEQNIYPLTAQLVDQESVEEAENEHGLTRDGLEKLAQLVVAPGFGAAVAMLQGGIEHHVEEEESELFRSAGVSGPSSRPSWLANSWVPSGAQGSSSRVSGTPRRISSSTWPTSWASRAPAR